MFIPDMRPHFYHVPTGLPGVLAVGWLGAGQTYRSGNVAWQLRRRIRTLVEHPEIGPERHAGNPIRMSRTSLVPAGPAPLLGEHTASALERVLGLDAAEVEALTEAGVCR